MEIKEQIKYLSGKIYEEVIGHYHILHANPELSFNEFETSTYICNCLKDMNIPFKSGIAGTGVLGVIKGDKSGKIIALRADMDALPIGEENNISFRSRNNHVMHACGHDVHVASLLGTAIILQELKEYMDGTVLLIFQPGEEKNPGGARLMLEAGLFEEYIPDAVIGQHVYVDYPVGEVGFEPGVIMAAADEIHVKIKGNGGHGALPHLFNDTVLAASQCIVSLQQIVSRRSNPLNPVVLSFGKFFADGATNVIPDEVTLAGSLRTMDEKERIKLKTIIREVIENTASAYGCHCEIDMPDGYPCVFNDEKITGLAKMFASEYLGENRVKGLVKRMTAEDFGFYSQLYPSTFYRFGVKGKEACGGLHTSKFLIDPEALKTSVGTMAYIALEMGKNA